ncbi:T9SS type A sorting domain-containing protein [Pontibacter qinzhouensis]|uniref:T9SS type A sorting domain-containing protein n=1 Tax=Pontibacter qinzhouensis TaxID=2603253 RepID=A0A5C8K9G5_9BACT|nr:T9SS type A sorting domain-containing protein [Pontibacter qinzhouensis]TXK46465.1 T9SS type A sorting domain-containing protein [Pontibacter qinzhouensis]
MTKYISALILACICFISCNDKPDIEPITSHVLQVFPNPAFYTTQIIVDNSENKPYVLQVFDTKGKVMLERNITTGSNNFQLDLSDQPVGKYQVILKADKIVATRAFLKL